MQFSFDVEAAAQNLTPRPANPAKAANPVRISERISNISNFSKGKPLVSDSDISPAEFTEMGQLLRQLAQLEGWSAEELEGFLDESRRMALANYRSALEATREAVRLALATWPEKPAKRARIVLCRLAECQVRPAANDATPEAA